MIFDTECTTTDERAVSPVVGVALLIAITVILAAVIGFVVLDTTVSNTDAPNARLTFEGVDDTVITHEGGDALESENVVVRVFDSDGDERVNATLDGEGVGETFNTGESFDANTEPGDTIVVFWDDSRSSREVQLAKATLE